MTLLELQRRMARAVMQPLSPSYGMAAKTADGTPMAAEAAAFVKPNDRLTSRARLEIYNRQYWFRIIDSLFEDFPGLLAVTGPRAFGRLARAYLTECPSRSFTMRNLGSQLEDWLRRNPHFLGDRTAVALDMVRLEWAHIEAFDGPEEKPLGPEDLLEPGAGLKAGLQPHLNLLALGYAVDDLRLRVNASTEDRASTSNAVLARERRTLIRQAVRLKRQPVFLAVYRMNFSVYYRRLAEEEFHLLESLRAGQPIGEAIEAALESSSAPVEEFQANLQAWFASWAELGWLCRFSPA